MQNKENLSPVRGFISPTCGSQQWFPHSCGLFDVQFCRCKFSSATVPGTHGRRSELKTTAEEWSSIFITLKKKKETEETTWPTCCSSGPGLLFLNHMFLEEKTGADPLYAPNKIQHDYSSTLCTSKPVNLAYICIITSQSNILIFSNICWFMSKCIQLALQCLLNHEQFWTLKFKAIANIYSWPKCPCRCVDHQRDYDGQTRGMDRDTMSSSKRKRQRFEPFDDFHGASW